MGGNVWNYTFLEQLEHHPDLYFVVPGPSRQVEQHGHLALLPDHSEFYHPDLVAASDAVIGKNGYSTLAEVYHAGIPFGYITRPRFRESAILADYIRREMSGLEITEAQFYTGEWLSLLPELLALPRLRRNGSNGAEQAAGFIYGVLEGKI